MKRLLGMVASPRNMGNSEIFIRELYHQLPGTWELSLIRFPDLIIEPCQACYRCLFGEMKCIQKDDFHVALEAIVQSDAYVVAAPTYFLGANAGLKLFLDRGLAFFAHIDQLWGKPAVGVAIAGIEGNEGYTKLGVESFIRLTMGDLRGSAVIYGALPGEIFKRPEGKETVRRLAEALVHGKEENSGIPTCTVCGGDTFRFLPNGQIRCMLCSNSGHYEWKEDHLQCHVTLEHSFSQSYDGTKQHGDLLRKMKGEFLLRRKEMKGILQQYDQEVNWIPGGRRESKR